jgi:hypothetical protein
VAESVGDLAHVDEVESKRTSKSVSVSISDLACDSIGGSGARSGVASVTTDGAARPLLAGKLQHIKDKDYGAEAGLFVTKEVTFSDTVVFIPHVIFDNETCGDDFGVESADKDSSTKSSDDIVESSNVLGVSRNISVSESNSVSSDAGSCSTFSGGAVVGSSSVPGGGGGELKSGLS